RTSTAPAFTDVALPAPLPSIEASPVLSIAFLEHASPTAATAAPPPPPAIDWLTSLLSAASDTAPGVVTCDWRRRAATVVAMSFCAYEPPRATPAAPAPA